MFRPDLYRGTGTYYDRFRPPYPQAMLDDLRSRVPISGRGRLLDLACGTGQIALPLAADFAEVCAVDLEPELVEVGKARARELGVGNVHWVVGRAEDAAVEGPFEVVGIGNAFHRLDRHAIAGRVMSWLAPGGCLALLWTGTPWRGDERWQPLLADVLDVWRDRVGATDRVPAAREEALARDPNERVLEAAGLSYLGKFDFEVDKVWTLEGLTGFVYSTSFLNREALGDHVGDFEQDLGERLLACEPGGEFRQTISFASELARRPA